MSTSTTPNTSAKYNPKQTQSYNTLKQVVSNQLSKAFVSSTKDTPDLYDHVLEKLTEFMKKNSIKIPSQNFKTPQELCNWIKENNVFDQLYREFSTIKNIGKIKMDDNLQKVLLIPLCEFLFNIADIDNNNQISPDEILAYLAINICDNSDLRNELIFRKMDKNHDNQLDGSEFEKIFILHFKMFCFSIIVDDLWATIPIESGGHFDFYSIQLNNAKSHFAASMDSIITQFERECSAKLRKVQEIARECFKSCDKNYDNVITLAELKKSFTNGFFSTKKKYIKKTNKTIMKAMFRYFMDEQEARHQAKKRFFVPSYSGTSTEDLLEKHTPHFDAI